ncbi:hypothetical protein PR202_ga29227 [Eleusine coracana subsp. coracana]|uniref:Uncharacterized protein n=1 Tax=Eleusine coracana subsp. coracana TaxID=191504 RepID=A0AAV5DLB8_ELECO|nr:hypothetical protein PR202_ga29227 [Eleusine coracana subsp. coracana]
MMQVGEAAQECTDAASFSSHLLDGGGGSLAQRPVLRHLLAAIAATLEKPNPSCSPNRGVRGGLTCYKRVMALRRDDLVEAAAVVVLTVDDALGPLGQPVVVGRTGISAGAMEWPV